MNPGRLRERLTLQASARTATGGGGSTVAWADVAGPITVWARVEPLETHERIQSMQTDAPASHKVTIRYRSDVTSAHRWKWGSRFLRIVSPPVNPDEKREYLEMLCAEDRG